MCSFTIYNKFKLKLLQNIVVTAFFREIDTQTYVYIFSNTVSKTRFTLVKKVTIFVPVFLTTMVMAKLMEEKTLAKEIQADL